MKKCWTKKLEKLEENSLIRVRIGKPSALESVNS